MEVKDWDFGILVLFAMMGVDLKRNCYSGSAWKSLTLLKMDLLYTLYRFSSVLLDHFNPSSLLFKINFLFQDAMCCDCFARKGDNIAGMEVLTG